MLFAFLFISSFQLALSVDEVDEVDILYYIPPGNSSIMCKYVYRWHQIMLNIMSPESSDVFITNEYLLEQILLDLGDDDNEMRYFYVCVNIFGGRTKFWRKKWEMSTILAGRLARCQHFIFLF